MNNFILFENVTFSYPEEEKSDNKVLNNLNLSIEKGEFIALIGQNGSGKSTFGKLLNALEIPDTGKVTIDGLDTHEVANHSKVRRLIGMIFQRPQDQIVATTVMEDVSFGPSNLGLPSDTIRQRVEDALSATGLLSFKNRPSYLLSAGETQRLALAGVLAMRPECVIFDETTAMLDPAGREMVMHQAKMLNNEGITIIFITHLMEEAVQAKRVLVLHNGSLVMDGSPAKVFSSQSKLRSYGLDLPPAVLAANALRNYIHYIPQDLLYEAELLKLLKPYSGISKTKKIGSRRGRNRETCIDVNDLSHVYLLSSPLAHQSLNKCNLKVASSSVHGVIGSTGSGKSTLLQHLNGLITPQSGKVKVLQYLINETGKDEKELRQKVGFAFQQPEDQIFEQYAGDEIAFAAKNFAVPGKIADIVRSAMLAVGLDFDNFKDRLTSTLSGGERRKVALASVLAGQPQILLLDEPLAGLDPLSRNEISSHLAEMKKKGITLVISTHQYEGTVELMDEITVLMNGSDRGHGSPGIIFLDDLLQKDTGIAPPLAMRIANRLQNLGWPLPDEIVSLKNLSEALSIISLGKTDG